MSDHVLKDLEPKRVFDYFYEITQVPRPSKKEEKIRAYIKGVAQKLNSDWSEDAAGNIVIRKPAAPGYENKPVVVLQGHLDMVCQKTPDTQIDFDNDPIKPRIDGEWVKATGTTLGADNGIAVATMLAILEDTTMKHGALELLFTVDEETGLTGALKLEPSMLKGRYLLNLDSEDEGVLFIGCSGGKDGVIHFPIKRKPAKENEARCLIAIEGGVGGHSGMDIILGRANANKILTRVLYELTKEFKFKLSDIKGGTVRNAIPRDAAAHIAVRKEDIGAFKVRVQKMHNYLSAKYQSTDPDLKIVFKETPIAQFTTIKRSRSVELIRLLKSLPNGVQAMSKDVDGLVETSVNLATIETHEKEIIIGSSHRSAIEEEKRDILDQVGAICSLTHATVKETDGYPGWKPNPQSKLLAMTKKVFKEIYGKNPKVTAIHAGLECGIIGEKFTDMDMISFGPTLRNVHSPDEGLHIPTVKPFYTAVQKLLETIA